MPVLPFHEAFVELRVDKNVPDELPQVSTSGGCKGRDPRLSVWGAVPLSSRPSGLTDPDNAKSRGLWEYIQCPLSAC